MLEFEEDKVDVSGSEVTIARPIGPMIATVGRNTAFSVGTTAALIAPRNHARKSIIIVNAANTTAFLGYDPTVNSVGASVGIPIGPGGSYADSGDGIYVGDIWAVSGSASPSVFGIIVSERQ